MNDVFQIVLIVLISLLVIVLMAAPDPPRTVSHYVLCPGMAQPIAATDVDPYGVYLRVTTKNGKFYVGPNCAVMPNPGDM